MLERRNGDFIRGLINKGHLKTCNDVSDGGLLITITEMAIASKCGVILSTPNGALPHAFWFGEDQARYVVTIPITAEIDFFNHAMLSEIDVMIIGVTGGDSIVVDGDSVKLTAISKSYYDWFDNYMSSN